LILVDTGPLVALCDKRDAHHARAVRHLKALAGSEFGTCESVIAEAYFHLLHRAGRQRLAVLLDELGLGTLPAGPDGAYRSEVFDWLDKYAEHEPDWADGCLAVLSARDGTARVWTYDREFRTTWRRPDASRIPLAID